MEDRKRLERMFTALYGGNDGFSLGEAIKTCTKG